MPRPSVSFGFFRFPSGPFDSKERRKLLMGKLSTASVEFDRLVSHDSATAAAAKTDGPTTAVVMAIWHITLPTSPTPNAEETKQSSPKGLLLRVPLRLPFFVVSSGQAGGLAFIFFFISFLFLFFFFLIFFCPSIFFYFWFSYLSEP